MIRPHLLKKPVITEKSIRVANAQNTYTFEVDVNATKPQIKAIIEDLYGVDVIKINTTLRNKATKQTGRRRLTKIMGKTKKALVTLKEGQNIDLFDTYQE